MSDTNKNGLVAGIERCIDDGDVRLIKHVISTYSRGDLGIATACFRQWEADGKLKIIKPLDQAKDGDVVVEMVTYITKPVSAVRHYDVEQFERILIGRIKQFKKYDVLRRYLILDGLEHCVDIAKVCLEKWAQEGKVQILKPIDQAEDDEEVARLLTLSHIEGKTPWLCE